MKSSPPDRAASSEGEGHAPDHGSASEPEEYWLSKKQVKMMIDWIEASPSPNITLGEADQKANEWFNKKSGCFDDYRIKLALEKKTLNGPGRREDKIILPGYGQHVTYKMHWDEKRFPFFYGLKDLDWKASTLTHREICMLKFIEDITNKPEWWIKVKNPETVLKWKQEALSMPWGEFEEHGDFTEKMADACFEELAKKAEIYQQTGLLPVMDYAACAIKSDTLLTDDLKQALRDAVVQLEHVPDSRKDWHPGSDGKVLNLVHPSLWPLVYEWSRIIPDKRITLENCLDYCGAGVVIAEPARPRLHEESFNYDEFEQKAISKRFQWLPCDVDLTGDRPRIVSYINNLHPIYHANFYPVLERFIENSLTAWDVVLRSTMEKGNVSRLELMKGVEYICKVPDICGNNYCEPSNRPGDDTESDEDYEDDDAFEENERRDHEWFASTHDVALPEPKSEMNDFMTFKLSNFEAPGILNGQIKRIQVIVKLANIHLTPEKPRYDGGTWHVEGQVNEHICATALYYYDCDNITESLLSFRTQANRENLEECFSHPQDNHSGIGRIFSLSPWQTTMQDIGSVLTREGRAIFFPNVYQHRVSPFELADKTRPGHRKILVLFLVDPNIEIISTANVPPQQRDWWAEKVKQTPPFSKLPGEIIGIIEENVDFPISEEAAKDIRKDLMAERTVVSTETNQRLDRVQWSFCEH